MIITTGPWKGRKTPDMTGHFLLGAKIGDVIVPANNNTANFNRNNPDAAPLEGSLKKDPEAGYCFSKYTNNCNENSKFSASFIVEPQDIQNALDAYKVVYIMKVE